MTPNITGGSLLFATLVATSAAYAEHALEEVHVVGQADRSEVNVARQSVPEVDAAALLRKIPGANINGNGPVSGIQQYRGMYGNRVAVTVDGASFASGGPNLMDPPLHYAPATMLESLTIYRGAAPVSIAQESIGGVVIANTRQGAFNGDSSWGGNGGIVANGQTVNNGLAGNALIAVASDHHKFHLGGLAEKGDDARFGDGEIRPSEYTRKRIDAGYALQTERHEFDFSAARNETGDAGTPALPMDIETIDSNLYRTRYRFNGDSWALEAAVNGNEVDHTMTNFHLRQPPSNPMSWRRNTATAESVAYKLQLEWFGELALWRIGTDGTFAQHNSDISNPNNAMFFVTNFNDATRDVVGAFAEAEFHISSQWELMAGLRYNRVDMNADDVGSSMAMMMAPVAMLADRFNNADRQSTDNNIDWVLRANWMPSERWRYTGAVSRKTRSAGYQEKFLWLPLQATGGLADGRNYVGDLNLNPEVAHELELGFDWDSGRANVAPRVYYRKVDDYIQGTPSDDALVNGVSGMMGNPFVPLQFSNVEATLYGFDMNWGVAMDDHWSLYGLLNYVRGERDDIDDNLYRIAAPNTTLGVNYQTGGWQVALEGVAYARQTKVSDTNGETETAGYGLLNVLGQLQMGEQLQLSLGVKNLLDRDYQNHLGGINRAVNEDIPVGDRLPGWGRNLYASVRWDF